MATIAVVPGQKMVWVCVCVWLFDVCVVTCVKHEQQKTIQPVLPRSYVCPSFFGRYYHHHHHHHHHHHTSIIITRSLRAASPNCCHSHHCERFPTLIASLEIQSSNEILVASRFIILACSVLINCLPVLFGLDLLFLVPTCLYQCCYKSCSVGMIADKAS